MKFAWSEERVLPKEQGVFDVAPPRQAYSHSASVGSLYTRFFTRSSFNADSFSQNFTASS